MKTDDNDNRVPNGLPREPAIEADNVFRAGKIP